MSVDLIILNSQVNQFVFWMVSFFLPLLVYCRSKTLSSLVMSMDGGSAGADRRAVSADKRGSFTHRSELSDSLRRANTQESNRLQVSTSPR